MSATPRPVDLSGLATSIDNTCAEIDRLRAINAELLAALHHMEVCQSCAQADWSACPRGGQQAIAAIAKAEGSTR